MKITIFIITVLTIYSCTMVPIEDTTPTPHPIIEITPLQASTPAPCVVITCECGNCGAKFFVILYDAKDFIVFCVKCQTKLRNFHE
jgi:hypothetical protein